MGRRFGVLAVLVAALPGCKGCTDDGSTACDALHTSPIDAAIDAETDAALADAAAPDAAAPDAGPTDAGPNLCTTAADTADHLEPIGGDGGVPQLVVDAFGTAALVRDAGGARIVRLGADGQRRGPDLVIAIADPYAIAFDGLDYRISERVAGNVQLRTVTAAGVVGAPVVIGAGTPLYGALAVHGSGDVAVLWHAVVDGSLRATVVPAIGAPVETVLDAPTSIVTTQLVGGVIATAATTARFVAAYARVESGGTTTTVMARALAPDGAAQVISTGGATMRERVQIAPGAVADTFLITWRDATTVHAATYHPVAGVALADKVVLTPGGAFFTRVGARGGPGAGFEVLVDRAVTASDRALELHAFDATGDPVGGSRRIATICTNAYSEENLTFVRNASVRYVDWFDLTLPDNLAAAF